MILLSCVSESPDVDEVNCSVCTASVTVSCVEVINTREGLERLLAGTLNTAPCPNCGTTVTAERPVYLDLPEPGIPYLIYAPIKLLEDDTVCEELNVDGRYSYVCYSLDELARQVRARLRLHSFQTTSRPRNFTE
jgi:CpXC protein